MIKYISMRQAFFGFTLVFCSLFFVGDFLLSSDRVEAQEGTAREKVVINADVLSYEDESGVITGSGNVQAQNADVQLKAHYIEYDSFKHTIKAHSDGSGSIIFQRGVDRLQGEFLEYDVNARKGYLKSASGKVDAFYLKGKNIEFFPKEEYTKSQPKSADKAEDVGAKWEEVYITTCDLEVPHYRLQSKEVVVIPGEKIIVRQPRVYYGKRLLFTYPFDYVVNEGKTRTGSSRLFPKIGYESDRGAGIGLSGPIVWNGGQVEFSVATWTKGITEGGARVTQRVTPDLILFAESRRTYNSDLRQIDWRPRWGAQYMNNGWSSRIEWSERDFLTVEKKIGSDQKYIVWKKPEWELTTPWWRDGVTQAFFRLSAGYGRYEDASNGPSEEVSRRTLGVEMYQKLKGKGQVEPFYHLTYKHHDYSSLDTTQQILDGVLGANWKIGLVDAQTAYVRRWVWGASPMGWDSWDEKESLYQRLAYTFKTSKPEEYWRASVRAGWDFLEKNLAEMVYELTYNRHCLRWDLTYRDQRQGGDDWFSLTLTVNAYPESPLSLSDNEIFEPGTPPASLPSSQ